MEDHPINRKLVTDLLEMDGFDVWPCADAEAALETLKNVHPHLILMDVALPGMDGLELTRLLKKDAKTQNIKIVAVTAFAMKTDSDKVIEAGCDGYITKPIDTRKFREQILGFLK